MFELLEKINARPGLFEVYTARELWDDEHTSQQMLSFHLNGEVDVSSRNAIFIERSAQWVASRFNINASTRIADFGCGPGLYAERLAMKEARVTGIDFSRRSILYAQDSATRKGLSIRYVHQDYLAFETDERFDVILMIMCDFCALNPDQRKKILEKFYELLAPNGSVLLDVYSLNAFEQKKELSTYEPNLLACFWSSNDYYGFLNTFKYDTDKVTLDKYTIIEPDRIRTIYNWLQYFSPKDIEREFAKCGFIVESLYSDVAGAIYDQHSSEFAIVAKKKEAQNQAFHRPDEEGRSPHGVIHVGS
jgi:SAM-dependent methyltransferase